MKADKETHMTLCGAALRYSVCIVLISVLFCMGSSIIVGSAYLAAGVYLNRAVLRQLVYWPEYATASEQAFDKMRHVAFWPIAYVATLARVMIVRVL